MFDSLNKYGLPVKYAVLFGLFAPVAVAIMNLRDPLSVGIANYVWFAFFGAACGFGAGYMRKLRGKEN